MKKLIAFDLDGTLAESKGKLDAEMAGLLKDLLVLARCAIISGGAWPQFQKQILPGLPGDADLTRLFLLPTCGTKFYAREAGQWTLLYSEDFKPEEKVRIIQALNDALDQSGFRPDHTFGEIIEDRGGQITLSVLGQDAPLEAKKSWDPDFEKRRKIKTVLEPMIPGFSAQLGGATSVDITRPGVDKAYGIAKLEDRLGVRPEEIIFAGDALFPGGNDYAAVKTGARCIKVRDPEDTKGVIRAILACLEPDPPQDGAAADSRS